MVYEIVVIQDLRLKHCELRLFMTKMNQLQLKSSRTHVTVQHI